MGDVIDLKLRFKGAEENADSANHGAPIMNITELREQQIESDRRIAKRTVLSGFLGATVLVPGRGLMKVSIFDVSKGGISFDVNIDSGHFSENEEVAFRFYFNHNVYFPFVVKISSYRTFSEEGIGRHGATFVSDQSNIKALTRFVDFLELVASDLKVDKGDLFIHGTGI